MCRFPCRVKNSFYRSVHEEEEDEEEEDVTLIILSFSVHTTYSVEIGRKEKLLALGTSVLLSPNPYHTFNVFVYL